MVHGQFLRLERSSAIVTDACGALPLPPLGVAEFAGLGLLPLDMLVIGCSKIIGHGEKK